LLKRWAAEKRIHREPIYKDLTLPLEKAMLGRIAYDFFQGNRLFFLRKEVTDKIVAFLASNLNSPKHMDGDEVLKAIEIQQGILVARDRTGGVLSFSHLTFQEYLTAQHFADHSALKKLAGEHLTDDRWHEVFLLTSGLARPRADKLLQAIAAHCSEIVAEPSVSSLLIWAEKVASNSDSPFKPAIKRIAALAIANLYLHFCNFANAVDLALTPSPSHYNERIRDIAETNSLINTLARSLGLDFNLCLDFGGATLFDSPYEVFRIFRENLHSLISRLKTKVKLEFLVHKEASLKVSPELNYEIGNYLKYVEKECESIGLPVEILEMTSEHIKCITSYLQANKLLLDCKDTAIYVSPNVWFEIEEGLISAK